MAAPRLDGRARRRLIALLRDDRPDPHRLLPRLLEFGRLEEVPACSEALHLLAHLDLPESSSEALLSEIIQHRRALTEALGRDPGTIVAATDYLSNVERLLVNPSLVEMTRYEVTERSAVTDPLTGLYNRRLFRSVLRREVRRSRRYDLVFSLLMLDLDLFKKVNDEFGHVQGDAVLQRVAAITRQALREADVACRYGGDEFVVILPETDRLGAFAVGDRLRRLVRQGFAERPTAGERVMMTVSGGIAAFPADGADGPSIVALADRTLYRAKCSGRDRVCLSAVSRQRHPTIPGVPGREVRGEA